MRKERTVALWLGTATHEDDLRKALRIDYSQDGTFRGSAFSRAFDLGRYDDSKTEALRHEHPPLVLDSFLTGVSYAESVLPGLDKAGATVARGDNCFVLLFDVFFEGERTARWSTKGLRLRFAAQTSYEAKPSA